MKTDRSDWRNLPTEQWNVRTFHAMVIELNDERFDVEKYVPMRNWGFEQGAIKRAIKEYGTAVLRQVFERAFTEYKPTREYPQLTAGFIIAFMASRIIPVILAEEQRRVMPEEETNDGMGIEEFSSWL